jgi:Thioesterase-like superfamily
MIHAEDIAALFLASDEARYVNGRDLVVDGGHCCGTACLRPGGRLADAPRGAEGGECLFMFDANGQSDLADAVFRIDGDMAIPSRHAAGPWNALHQHGSAPSSLIAWACEKIPTPVPMRVTRMTIDLMRPVPIAPLTIRSRIIREGRKIQLCEIQLFAQETEVVRASVLKVRTTDVVLPPEAAFRCCDLPLPDAGREASEIAGADNPFLASMSMRVVKGGLRLPGPGAIWFRAERPIIEGIGISALMRAAITADFCNGVSSVLDFSAWTFINADLTISLARDPIGEWILLDAESWFAPNGGGMAFGKLADREGYFGRAAQNLVVERV